MLTQDAVRTPDTPGRARPSARRPDVARLWRRRVRRANTLEAAMWVSGIVAGALAVPMMVAAPPAGVGDIMTNLGILTGLVGTDLLLVMLVLAARIPVVDRAIGHDRAIAVHRSMGKPVLYLLLAHAILLLIGYGASQGIDPVPEIWSMLAIPDMPLAFLGLGALVAVVVTSVVAVRRRFSYEAWHLTHLLGYAAVLVAVPHELSVGGILSSGSVQRAYWISLYILAFGAVIAFRFVEPLLTTIRHRIVVDRVEEMSPGVTSLYLRGHDLGSLGARGGQFFVWRFWTTRTWWHAHPLSLSMTPSGDTARVTVRTVGAGTRAVSAVKPGTRVSIEGPYGIFTDLARTSPNLAIIAAGIGVTPVRSMLQQASLRRNEATVLLRASNNADTALWDETIDLAANTGADVYTMIGSRATLGPRWMSDADARRGVTLHSVFPTLATSDLYLCGPGAWMEAVAADARANGLAEHQIHTERFEW